MRLGIIGAMSVEVDLLTERMTQITRTEQAGMTFFQGQLEGVPAVVAQCGVGKVNAAMCVQILCDRFSVSHIINTGVAGCLCKDLDIGDFVIGKDAVYHDFDCSRINPDYLPGQVPGVPMRAFPADSRMIQLVVTAAESVSDGKCRIGTIASGDRFICTKAEKTAIIEDTGALCVEMEGAAIAQASWRNGIPFVVIRAMGDKADETAHVDSPTFEALTARRCAALTISVAQKWDI